MNSKKTAALRWSRAAITRGAVMLGAALAGVACGGGGESSTEPGDGLAGTYELRQVDDAALPATIHQGPWLDRLHTRFYNRMIMQITGGEVELYDDDTYVMTFDMAYNADGVPGTTSIDVEGDYTVQGADVSFRYGSNPPSTFLGRLQGGVLTIPIDFMGKGASNAYAFKR